MIGRTAVLVLLAVATPSVAAAGEFSSPPPNLLFQLQRQNQTRPLLAVTIDTSRVFLRAQRLDHLGLSGFEVPEWQSPPPDPIPWRSIARIDRIDNAARKWQIIGFVVGGGLGFGLGTALGESFRSSSVDAYGSQLTEGHGVAGGVLGMLVLGGIGAWQGGRFGSGRRQERVWYVAAPLTPPPAPPTPARPDTASLPPVTAAPPAIAAPPSSIDAPESAPRDSRAVSRAIRSMGPHSLIRMRGDFGSFQGFAGVIGPVGLENLRTDRKARSALPADLTGLITWERIDHIERRGSAAGRGAVIGAVGLGVMGAMFATALNEGFGGSASTAGAAAVGGGYGGGIGLLLGALVGAAFPAWHVVYDGP